MANIPGNPITSTKNLFPIQIGQELRAIVAHVRRCTTGQLETIMGIPD